MRKEDVHIGYLSYTPRTIIERAFALINEPYGWGGMYGEQDCSRYIQEVFATVGIHLPRNSSKQAQVGKLIAEFNDETKKEEIEETIIEKAVGGVSLLYMRDHIMIYLGSTDNKAYAIHDTWGYRQNTWRGDIVRVIDRVAVTDLYLGKGSQKGSYLKQIRSVRIIASE
ncbi:MAG: NlpC/P60 family protein [Syntrophales bacterium]